MYTSTFGTSGLCASASGRTPEVILPEWHKFLMSLVFMARSNFLLMLVIIWLCHMYLLTWSADMVWHMSFTVMVCWCGLPHVFCCHGLLTWSTDMVCHMSFDVMVYWHGLPHVFCCHGLFTWSTTCPCRRGLLTWSYEVVFHVSLLMWSADQQPWSNNHRISSRSDGPYSFRILGFR
jgi:hypothetical protein